MRKIIKNGISNDVIRYFLAVVFISAAGFRIVFFQEGIDELIRLHIPWFFTIFIIIFELVCGLLLLSNKYVKTSAQLLVYFLIIAIVIAFIPNFIKIVVGMKELFVFDATPTDILLHFCYLLFLLILLHGYSKKKN